MFDNEAALSAYKKKEGQRRSVELVADVNTWTSLHEPKTSSAENLQPSLGLLRSLLDRNEHFIELSNMGEEDRSLMLMVLGLMTIAVLVPLFGATQAFRVAGISFVAFASLLVPIGMSVLIYFLWPQTISPNFFTALRPRYRFNRTTGKVYVLRPARYGGNVVLDWHRVKAHVDWCAPREMTWDDLRDPVARKTRQDNGGGPTMIRGLVLYWPPLDPDDRERKGEEVLWVGPKFSGEGLWQYIRTFMEQGMDAVPAPTPHNWLRKGFQSAGEHLEEAQLGPARALDETTGRSSIMTTAATVSAAPWAPLHALAERLCYWPTFPEEWNSDCGQKRREDGIGVEEPTRWEAI